MSDAAVIELARLLTEAVQARSAVAQDPQTSASSEQPIGDGVAAYRFMRERDDALRLAEQRSAELEAAQAQIVELRARLEEREGDMHLRIRADYDRTVADLWRAKVAEVEHERDEARAKVIKYESKVERVMRVFTGLVEGHAVTKDDIKVAFDFARSIAEEKRDGNG